MDEQARPPGGMTLAAFGVAVWLGGGNFLAVRFSNRELDPVWGAALRFSIAALLFIAIVSVMRLRWPRGRTLVLNLAYGLLSITLFYALVYWALVRVSAGIAAVVLAIVPLVTLLLAAAHRMERLGGRAIAGSVLALTGILWMTIGLEDVELPLGPLVAMLLSALAVGEGVIVGKKLAASHPAVTNAVALGVGAPSLIVLSLLFGDSWVLPRQPEVVWSLVYLVTLGSVGLFVLVLLVVRHWTASATSYMFVLFPVVTMILGAWLADEPITSQGAVGAAVVVTGVWFGALSPAARADRAALAPPVRGQPTTP
ncbi:MAG TPA: EamA family transporter [Acidimicrobiia bacterium]|nr:EamA family transporter [Acidimicrobiia bacterium]